MRKPFATKFDEVPNDSEEKIAVNVSRLISYIESGLQNDLGSGDLERFSIEVLKYLKKLLKRFQSNIEEDVDYLSWLGRNVHELFVLSKYSLQSIEKVTEFLLIAVDDYRDIEKNFFKDYEPTEDDIDGQQFLESMNRLNNFVKENEIEIEDWKSTWKMAKEVGCELDHRIVFKLTSKYVHPTSLFLFGNKNFVHGKNSRKAIYSVIQWYAARLLLLMPERINELKSAS